MRAKVGMRRGGARIAEFDGSVTGRKEEDVSGIHYGPLRY